MKPTSIIFLVFAILLIVGGILTCSAATSIAEKDGYALFHDSEDGGTIVREAIETSTTKLELVFTDAEVNVYYDSEAEDSYVEFINFRDGLYTLVSTAQILSFDEIPNLNSLLHFKSGFSFSGLRGLLRTRTLDLGPKSINVHLAPDNELKIISLTCDSCTVNSDSTYCRFDLLVDAEKTATLNLTHFRTASALRVSTETAVLKMEDIYFDSLHLEANAVTLEADDIYLYHLTGEVREGTLSLTNPGGWGRFSYNLKGSQESFTLNGEPILLPYDTSDPNVETPDYEVALALGSATLTLTDLVPDYEDVD